MALATEILTNADNHNIFRLRIFNQQRRRDITKVQKVQQEDNLLGALPLRRLILSFIILTPLPHVVRKLYDCSQQTQGKSEPCNQSGLLLKQDMGHHPETI